MACLWVGDVREPLDRRWNVGQSQKFLRAQGAARLGLKAQECFLLGAMDGFGSGSGESIGSLTRTEYLWANSKAEKRII
jgi:hypothetical protein